MDRDLNTDMDQGFDLAEALSYLEGKLDADAAQAFEARMAQNPEDMAALEALDRQLDEHSAEEILALQSEFLSVMEGASAAMYDSEAEFAAPEMSLEELAFEADMAGVRRTWRYWGAGLAAGIALLMLVAIALLRQDSSPQDLFLEHFAPYEDLYSSRNPIAVEEAMTLAMAAYNAAEYDSALLHFEVVLRERPVPGLPYLYAGVSALALGRGGDAAGFLAPLADGKGELQPVAAWYMALAELEQGSAGRAQPWLEPLAARKDKWGEKARALLDDLPDPGP